MSLERQQNQQDDHALGERVEKFVWTQTHEVRTTNPPWWKFWESPKSDEVLIQRRPTANWLLSQFIGTLPINKQTVARQSDVNARLLRRIEAELKRYETSPR